MAKEKERRKKRKAGERISIRKLQAIKEKLAHIHVNKEKLGRIRASAARMYEAAEYGPGERRKREHRTRTQYEYEHPLTGFSRMFEDVARGGEEMAPRLDMFEPHERRRRRR